MEVVIQFSVFLMNKPGVLAKTTRQVASAKINILAMTMVDSSEHGVLRLVAADPEKLRKALDELNLPMTETDVLMVEMPNRTGSLAEVCSRLAQAHVNINYAYCTTGGRGGKARGMFKVGDMRKAMKILTPKALKHRDMKRKVRRPTVLR